MTESPTEVVESVEPPAGPGGNGAASRRAGLMLLLFGVPWWTLLAAGAAWPTAVFVAGTLMFVAALRGTAVL